LSHLDHAHYGFGKPEHKAVVRKFPEDFQGIEQLSFSVSGEGQHVLLFVEKRDLNTDEVAKQLARFADVRPVAVGYAGLKDRHAVTRQWFSVDLAGKSEPDWQDLNSDRIKVLEAARHNRKLKHGAVKSNRFEIVLREFNGDHERLEQRLEWIQQHGVPNYFGEQRFGRHDANLKQAEKIFLQQDKPNHKRISRHLRGIYLSAIRSFLFNQVVSQRVADRTWNQPIAGDVLMLDGTHSVFTIDAIDEEIVRRVNDFDIHPTGPLWGDGAPMTSGDALAVENQALQPHRAWREFLEATGMKQERRALRMKVADLEWEWQGSDIKLAFQLPSGSYATSVLRELVLSLDR
jgi:tRNA pseudouridine13 synthase